MGEVDVAQLGMAIEAEALPDERLEVAGQEVGEEERPRLVVVECGEELGAGEQLVAVRAGEALDAGMVGEQSVERAAGPAVGVGDEGRSTAGRGLVEDRCESRDDALGAVVEVRRQVA